MTRQKKTWFITGASSGFGRSLVEEAIARGDRVVATARDTRSLSEVVAIAPDRVHAVRLDLTKPAEIAQAVEAALAQLGYVDVLVNNAGFSIVGAVEETSDEELRSTLETMFFGPVALTRAFLPHMRGRRTGTIVQISSMGGLMTAPGFGAYCAAKHALEAVSESLAAEVGPLGMRVLIVEPGAFRTKLFGSGFRVMPPLDVYEPTVGATRAYTAKAGGTQEGDPVKAARAMVDAVDAGAPTLRLPLGADAVLAIREKLARVEADVDRTEAMALATSFR